ncbi:sodium- and chloride-dependent GABA transporter 3-like isoform X4 [Phyllopteryx taeniolatus]|uniref:sodium- and chloride-dependent GABA transporter 3-like isoform X4 n=1 Tax=Phyllopteryx taeniolatus TaxID=161469 RepID=UPI002AD255DA|nr:sodium- and chloride-dependent GABA transporter 3-like isoform X4 [Phyllopteryx taeniolatus]
MLNALPRIRSIACYLHSQEQVKVQMEPTNIPEENPKSDHDPNDPFLIKRGKWANKREFILAVVGEIIGLGNVWRFPYLCFKNGGGAFLVPYVVFLLTCAIPIFFLELSLGQLTGQGGITCWRKICPLLEGIGYGSIVVMLYTVMYYIVILAWAFLYFFSSFQSELPWASCNNTWNTGDCVDNRKSNSANISISANVTSSVEEFWQKRILSLSGGIEEMGSIRWDLAGCLVLSWIMCYFCVWKGVKSSGKVVYFTAPFPYVMMIALVVRGLTLPGAMDGIRFYLSPDPTRLSEPQFVYLEALVTSISDLYPSIFFTGHRRKILLLGLCGISFCVGFCMVTEGGLYVFHLFDYYACAGIPLITFGIMESLCIGWIYGADNYYNYITDMIGYRPSLYLKYCWKFVTPLLLTGVLVLFFLVKFSPLKYNNTYLYPWWAHALGLLLAFSSVIMIPLWILYSVAKTPGSLPQRIRTLTTPTSRSLCVSVNKSEKYCSIKSEVCLEKE